MNNSRKVDHKSPVISGKLMDVVTVAIRSWEQYEDYKRILYHAQHLSLTNAKIS